MNRPDTQAIRAVDAWLEPFESVAVAVSGGIDSITLATLAARRLGVKAELFHAVSPAVPPEATARVRELAARRNWSLRVADAAELERDEYRANPVNRCFFCKQSLYSMITARTSAQIVSGTNADDLREYRPGLDAARRAGVRHPFAELAIDKPAIRGMARILGLGELSELPASPCLSSRVETGIGITPDLLKLVHAAESTVRSRVHATDIRCRIRQSGVVIELESGTLSALSELERREIGAEVAQIFAGAGAPRPIALAPYRRGSAFLVKSHD